MVIDLSDVSISKGYYFPGTRFDKQECVDVDFDPLENHDDPYSIFRFQQFNSIEDVKAFILELWEVAKETWLKE